ncbi:MAG: NAD(+)--dinitrogen-reductase ADP-D-ribosyltransferase [Chromatiales bacterium]|jgi:NAD+--dinitrogen-reductase ADP-D-ribosyltransferase
MDEHRQSDPLTGLLPRHARLPVNHCNLPSFILGSLTFQQHPVPLHLDSVEELHVELFRRLDTIDDVALRSVNFQDYMRSGFLLDHLEEAGFDPHCRHLRNKADYLRILRGWLFDPDGKEAAVLKSWVESRFGLLPRNHRGPLRDFSSINYMNYMIDRARGLYNTNALESQIDLLFSFCQYEIRRQYPGQQHIRLYRGINQIHDHEVLKQADKRNYILILNNLNSFTSNRERADEFGDFILATEVPLVKLLYIPGLLPHTLQGEEEYMVIGGVYQVKLSLM